MFAAISDMTTINKIMGLSTVDRTQDTNFGAGSGNLGFTDVPVDADGSQVFIKNAFLVTDTLATAQAISAVQSALGQSALPFSNPLSAGDASALAASGAGGGGSSLGLSSSNAVPEPTTVGLMILGAFGFGCSRRRR